MNPSPKKPSLAANDSTTVSSRDRKSFPKKQKTAKWHLLGWLLTLGLGGGAIALGIIWHKLENSLPASVADVPSYARPNTLTIKAGDGTVLKEIGPVTHEKVKLDNLPDIVHQAFVANEDRRFYEHEGVDFKGIARAVVVNFKAGEAAEGGSTITQQLARMAFLDREKRIWRKLKEMRIASEIEKNLEKEEILETYLNLVYLGSGSYGVADAAWVYFGKTPQELNIAEAATLASVVPAPSIYSPFQNPQLVKKQRDLVIDGMVEQGFISPADAVNAKATEIVTDRHNPKRLNRRASYFTNYIEEELPKYVAPEILQAGGVVIETTLNPQWQQAAEKTSQYALKQYGSWMKFKQAAIVAIDPRTGHISAMVGGQDFGKNQYNRVTQAQRQPGSTFKTFVYSAAIAAGFSPYKNYLDAEYFVDGYKPKNYKEKYRDKYISIYDALVTSTNTVALRTMIDVGWNPTIEIAKKMGIKSELKPTYSLALGSWEVNLLELTSAYGTLANKGNYREAHGISKILDRQGNIVYQADFKPQVALNEETAAMMTWMLRGVVTSGTAIPAQIGRPAAGKTGTSDESRDLWYIGYIPQVTTGVWLGNDDNQPTTGTSGVAAEMWRKFMLEVVKEMPVESFPPRPKLVGRETTVATEALKPKRTYYKFQPKPVYRQPAYRQPSRRTYKAPVVTQPSAPQTAPAPASTPQAQPVAKPAPAPKKKEYSRINNKPIPANHPINDPNRDWVKERLGRP